MQFQSLNAVHSYLNQAAPGLLFFIFFFPASLFHHVGKCFRLCVRQLRGWCWQIITHGCFKTLHSHWFACACYMGGFLQRRASETTAVVTVLFVVNNIVLPGRLAQAWLCKKKKMFLLQTVSYCYRSQTGNMSQKCRHIDFNTLTSDRSITKVWLKCVWRYTAPPIHVASLIISYSL